MRYSLFLGVTQRTLTISKHSFGATYLSHFQGSRILAVSDRWRWNGYVVPRGEINTNLRCVTSQKSEDLIYNVAEDWNYATTL